MIVTWMGHACFLFKPQQGPTVLTDPYEVGGSINYAPIRVAPDIVVVSHDHFDHNKVSAVPGTPEVVKGDGNKAAKGVEFRGIGAYHDAAGGAERGTNTIFCFALDGLRLCHLGDLGHELSGREGEEIGAVDILLVPVGGNFTIDAAQAERVCRQLGPKVVLPMHYKTPRIDFPIAGVEDFVRGKTNVRQVEGSDVEFLPQSLPTATEIVVLNPAT
ncbi:MAG: MBL fold metallo-hydrolase [Chloroflexota bacterium]